MPQIYAFLSLARQETEAEQAAGVSFRAKDADLSARKSSTGQVSGRG
jgi:hypothetical protein